MKDYLKSLLLIIGISLITFGYQKDTLIPDEEAQIESSNAVFLNFREIPPHILDLVKTIFVLALLKNKNLKYRY